MNIEQYLPLAWWTLWVFALGLGIGSFLNVLVFRLPFEKSAMWPNSRCGACLRPLPFADNLPLWGYLRRRGKCRFCRTGFSSRYFWVELCTGLMFAALYLIEIAPHASGGPELLKQWFNVPGLDHRYLGSGSPLPPGYTWVFFAAHAALLSALFASALIDLDYRVIPPQITYPMAALGLVVSAACPWPWPTDPALLRIPADAPWTYPTFSLPTGLALWPAWEPPGWAPAGSWQLGLLTGLAGAAAGTAVIRLLKFAFEWGFGQDAVGLGDADLLMMAGAFLGWQPVVLAVPMGAAATLLVLPLMYAAAKLRRKPFDRALPFGPGLAAGVVICWFGWPVLGEAGRATLFDPVVLGFVSCTMFGGLLVAGMVLRRGGPAPQ